MKINIKECGRLASRNKQKFTKLKFLTSSSLAPLLVMGVLKKFWDGRCQFCTPLKKEIDFLEQSTVEVTTNRNHLLYGPM